MVQGVDQTEDQTGPQWRELVTNESSRKAQSPDNDAGRRSQRPLSDLVTGTRRHANLYKNQACYVEQRSKGTACGAEMLAMIRDANGSGRSGNIIVLQNFSRGDLKLYFY